MPDDRVVVMIASPIKSKLVARIEAVDEHLDVRYEPDLVPPLHFPDDPRSVEPFRRTPAQEERWRDVLSQAEVLFGLPGDSADGLADTVRTCSGLRFIQATGRGAGEQVRAAGLHDEELARVTIATTGGLHVGPRAEFALFGLLAFTKGLPRLVADQVARRWDPRPMAELAGATLLIVGLSSTGLEVARLAKTFGMRVIGVSRDGRTDSPDVDEVRTARFLGDLLPVAHGVVCTLPLTEATRAMIDEAAIARMRNDAILVDIGTGGVVDEAALVQALEEGRLAGAVLDVFATEPLPPGSALWGLPNVLISPHSAGRSANENENQNERIVALFCENLRRYLEGTKLLSQVHVTPDY